MEYCCYLVTKLSLFVTTWTVYWLLYTWDFLGKNTGVGCHFLFQRIFPTQGLNLLHWHMDSFTAETPEKTMMEYCYCCYCYVASVVSDSV